MKKYFALVMSCLVLNACTTEYILMDETANPVDEGYYTENTGANKAGEISAAWIEEPVTGNVDGAYVAENAVITGNDVFVVNEGADFVTYQYKNVRVDEISPLASLYCADVAHGMSPYLREVNLYHNGFMRATFDCVSLAI